MGALSSTSPIQNSAESPTGQNELNDNKVTVEQVPKPRKFFKSRNSAPPAEIQQQMAMQSSYHQQQQSYQNHQMTQQEQGQYTSGGDEEDQAQKREVAKKKKVQVKREKVEKPPKPPKAEKVPKPKREKKVKAKELTSPVSEPATSDTETQSPTRRGRNNIEPTRTSGRSRAKCVNYNEEAGEDEFFTRIDRRIVPRNSVPATITSPQEEQVEKPQPTVEEVPLPHQSPSLHPPIVLRISKVWLKICKHLFNAYLSYTQRVSHQHKRPLFHLTLFPDFPSDRFIFSSLSPLL